MEVTAKSLHERYSSMNTKALSDFYHESELTDLAVGVLEEVITSRGLDWTEFITPLPTEPESVSDRQLRKSESERHMTTAQTDSRPLPDITEYKPEFPRTEIALLVLIPSFVAVMRWVTGPKLFESLFAKTFVILGSQLLVTWFTASMILWYVRLLYRRGMAGITATQNEEGQFDLEIAEGRFGGYLLALIILSIGLFLSLFFLGRDDLSVGIPLFTLWSIVTGALMALALIRVDENLGAKVLGITAAVTFITALIGIYSGIDFAFLGNMLFIALILLIIGYVVRLFVAIPRATQRFMAGFGVAIFTGYLLYDFNRLNALEDTPDANTWSVAMDVAIDIYLDIINLFLLLLDLMSE